jgi:hypothetical protein
MASVSASAFNVWDPELMIISDQLDSARCEEIGRPAAAAGGGLAPREQTSSRRTISFQGITDQGDCASPHAANSGPLSDRTLSALRRMNRFN